MTRQEHIQYIKNNPFEFSVNPVDFSESDVVFIEKYGNWLEALSKKKIQPCTVAQEKFVEEMNTRETPSMEYVELWKKYKRKEWEKENPQFINIPPVTLKDESFGTREEFQAMRKNQFKTTSQNHRN